MENVLFSSYVMFRKGFSWQSVLNVRRKSRILKRAGRWQVEKTRRVREQNSPSDSMNAVENLSGLS
jgi:hypothetical protein